MTEKVTYDSLLKDDEFLNDAYHALRAQGINVSNNRKDILDRMLTNKRYFDTNLASTFVIGDNVKDMSNANKQSYANAITKIEQLPSIGKEGAAPTSSLVKDYLVAGVTDPTNLISILAGAFTFGAGTAATQAGKETAKAGIKKLLKTKIKNTVGKNNLKAVGKTLLAEGAIAGVGGGAQALKAQDVDMAIGRRKKGDFDLAQAGQQALLEGIASPVAGFALAGIGKAGLSGIKGTGKLAAKGLEKTKDIKFIGGVSKSILKGGEQAAQYINSRKNYLLPFGGVDDITQQNFEIGRAVFKDIKKETEDVIDDIRINENRFVKDDSIKRDLVNDAMEGNTAQLQKLQEQDEAMYNSVKKFVDLRKKVYDRVFKYVDPQSDKVQSIYKIDPDNYMKRIFARSQNRGTKMPFKFWRKYEANDEYMKQLTDKIKVDKNLQVQFGIREGTTDGATGKVETVGELKKTFQPKREGKIDIGEQNRLIERFAERRIYDTFYPRKKETLLGSLKKRKDIDPILQKIWGVNYSPAVRAAETIGAITEPVGDVLMADQIAKSLKGRGIGIQAESLADAMVKAKELGRPDEDLVPLVGTKDDAEVGIQLKRSDVFNPDLGQVFVPRDIAQKINVLTDTKPVFGNSLLGSLFSGANGYLKKGVTVYNPFGHIRNAMGVPQYVAASGNLKAIPKYAREYIGGGKEAREKINAIASRLGVTATNVEINQILGRLADARKIEDEKGLAGFLGRRFLDLASGGMASVERTGLGKKFSRAAERTYTGTDDVGKVMTLLSERGKAQEIFDNLTPEQKQLKRIEYSKNFGVELPKKTLTPLDAKNLNKFDDDMLYQEAAGKTLNIIPVYDRVPKILEKMRDIPIIGAFTAFPAENIRNKYNILKLGAQELKEGFETGNKGLIKSGGQRLRQQLAMAALPTVAAYTYNQVMGTDKAEPGIRKTQPEWAKYHALQIRPKGKDAEGNETYGVTDLSYNNPDQYVLDIITPLMMAAASGEDVVEKLDELLPYAIKKTYEPFLTPSMATELGLSFVNYAKANTDEGRIRHLTNSYKLIEPGITKLLRDVGGDAAVESGLNVLSEQLGGRGEIGTRVRNALNPSYFGDTAKLSRSFTELGIQPTGVETPFLAALYPFRLGLKEQDYKPKKQIGFAVSNLMRNANGTLKSTAKTIKNDLSNPNQTRNLALTSIIQDYNEALEEQFAAQQGIFEMINDLKGFMTEKQIRDILSDKKIKAAGGFSNTEITNLINGRFTVPVFDKKSIREAATANPSIAPYVRNIQDTFLALESKYKDLTLQTDSLPDLQIGGK
jgi:hypothetical protein